MSLFLFAFLISGIFFHCRSFLSKHGFDKYKCSLQKAANLFCLLSHLKIYFFLPSCEKVITVIPLYHIFVS